MAANFVRTLVSRQKKRIITDGFNLDLTYITDNIVAMGFPSENLERFFRNKMSDVQRFLDSRHPEKYKVYNLCSERSYEPDRFHGRVCNFPFDDHNAPPLSMMFEFCQDVSEWLSQSEEHIAVVHCKAGKGRTGVMVAAYLLYSGLASSAAQAIYLYGEARTNNNKGITIPSQLRYVNYFDQALKMIQQGFPLPSRTLLLGRLELSSIPRFSLDSSCNPVIRITMNGSKIFDSAQQALGLFKSKHHIVMRLPLTGLPLWGDVRFEFFHRDILGQNEKMFQCWLHTGMLDDSNPVVTFEKSQLDKAHKDRDHKIFMSSFALRLVFINNSSNDSINKSASPEACRLNASNPSIGSFTTENDTAMTMSSSPRGGDRYLSSAAAHGRCSENNTASYISSSSGASKTNNSASSRMHNF